MDFDKFKNLLGNVGKINIPDVRPALSDTYMFDPNRKEYHSPEEIIEETKSDEFERPDFSEWKCKICDKAIEEGYSWYYLRHERDEAKSVAICSKDCLDKFVKGHHSSDYEIYEYSRCNAYYKCEEIGNLRNMCEFIQNKTYQSIFPLLSSNHCEPAQAGSILSAHKLTEVLVDFSKQTEEQFLSNKKMTEKNAQESSKHFKITTWMTVLVIILTIVNIIPTFINWGRYSNYRSEQLAGIEARIDEITLNNELSSIYRKLSEIITLLENLKVGNTDISINEIIILLESIEADLE